MDDFMPDLSPREELERSILATMPRPQERLRGVIEKHEIHRRLGEQEAALGDGPTKACELLSLGEENGYTPRMPHPANFVAGVAVFREGFGRGAAWNWILLGAHKSEPLKNT